MGSIDIRQTNKLNLVFQSLYALLLSIFVIGSYMIEGSTIIYPIGFITIGLLGFSIIFISYFKNKCNLKLKYMFAAVQMILYLYIMIMGHADFRFAFILPILFYLVLYHSVGFVISISLLAIAVNLLNVIVCIYIFHRVTYSDTSRYVIQLMVIIWGMLAASITSWFYNKSYNRNISQATELEQISLSTIETIASTIDAKDAYTQGHSRRVAEYSLQIAKHMGVFSETQLRDIHYIGLLHDVGKIAVPDSVLNKPTRLTNHEFDLMKTHTTAGGDIIKDVKNIPGMVDGVKYHHERYDGNGYPDGLKGEEIPRIARIISLADAYDAMTSNRVYRKPLPYDVVISEIKTGRGTQFDPEVVDAFLECIKDGEILFRSDDYLDKDKVEAKNENAIGSDSEFDKELKDELTGAFHEKYGLGVIGQKLIDGSGALVLFNIVGLRRINEELGFMVGDYYLKMVADTIIRCRYNPFTVRFNGNQFLCYVEGMDKESATTLIRDCMNRVDALEENDPMMEKSLALTCAAKIVENSSKTINEHVENLEKVLYLLKGKEGEFEFFDKEEDEHNAYNISKDMEMLIDAIKDNGKDTLSYIMNNQSIENAIKLIKSHNTEEMGIVLFTVKPMDEEHIIAVNLDYAMNILEEGMSYVIGENGIVSYYSSLQRMAVIYGNQIQDTTWKNFFDTIEKDVLSFFHKNYDKIDVEIKFNASVID